MSPSLKMFLRQSEADRILLDSKGRDPIDTDER